MTNWKQSLIRRFFDLKAIQRGSFNLSTGQKSDFYIDARKVTLDYYGLKAIVDGIMATTDDKQLDYHLVGGPSLGADAIVGACITNLFEIDGGFLVRNEGKTHGTQKVIEGDCISSDRYILLDDVVTTGSNLRHCIKLVGKPPVAVFAVVDRGMVPDYGFGCPFFPLLTLKDLGL